MRGFTSLFLLVAALACLVLANNSLHQQAAKYRNQRAVAATPLRTRDAPRKRETSTFLNSKSSKFAVNGTALPDVDFNIGESYAGLLPISSNKNDPNQLFFWFFPSQNPKAKKEIVIWLNGGPGCSSLDGLFQENGPFIWQSGTYEPVHNPYSYTNLTNVVYIDQPVSTGLSRGNKTVNNELDVAADFRGFWKNFVQTFGMQGYEVYIVGESYAGKYIPYIAAGFLDTNNTKYYNLKGIQVNDGVINSGDVTQYAPVFPALQYFQNVIRLNDTFMEQLSQQADRCGYTEFFDKYSYQFPPSGPFPPAPDPSQPGCDIYDDIYAAVYLVNPCFNIYHLTDYCPYVWDVMGFPSLGVGPNNYFNRSDVQAQLHIPPTNYFICGGGDNIFPNGDQSPEVYLSILPSVIERTNNVIVGHGLLDFLLFANGSLITIQNMTWNGHQGFQTAPSRTDNFFVPYHQSLDGILNEVNGADPYYTPEIDTAGAGFQGVTHTERGLTFVTVNLAGHEIPQYVPGAAYRQLEFLLGRIGSLEQQGDYTTQTGDYTGTTPLVRR